MAYKGFVMEGQVCAVGAAVESLVVLWAWAVIRTSS